MIMKHDIPAKAISSIAAVLLAAGAVTTVPGCSKAAPAAVTEPIYPKMAQYPDVEGNGWEQWNSSRSKQLSAPEGYSDSLWSFYGDSVRTYLSGTQESRVYSPVVHRNDLVRLRMSARGYPRNRFRPRQTVSVRDNRA